MAKKIIAVGFLYNPKADQFLLLTEESQTQSVHWSFISSPTPSPAAAKNSFQQAVSKKLHYKPNLSDIYPVYDYFDPATKSSRFVFYAEVSAKDSQDLGSREECVWLSAKQITKLKIDQQTKHDIVIAQRVMGDIARKNNPEPAQG